MNLLVFKDLYQIFKTQYSEILRRLHKEKNNNYGEKSLVIYIRFDKHHFVPKRESALIMKTF